MQLCWLNYIIMTSVHYFVGYSFHLSFIRFIFFTQRISSTSFCYFTALCSLPFWFMCSPCLVYSSPPVSTSITQRLSIILFFFSFLLNIFISLFTQLFVVNVLRACEILLWFLFSMWVIEFHLSKVRNCTYSHSFLQCTCTCYTHNGHYWLCSLHFYTDIPTALVNVFHVVVHIKYSNQNLSYHTKPHSVSC
jgi:hypothetical protein